MIASNGSALLATLSLIVGVVGSAAFSGLETGMYVINKVRLELRAAAGERRARRLHAVLARPNEMLVSLMVGNNTMNYLVSIGMVALLRAVGTSAADLYATIFATLILFVLGEMLPKNLFRIAGELLTYRLGWFITATMFACRWLGLSALLAGASRIVLRLWHGDAAQEKPVEPRQRVRAFLAEGHAHGVMTPYQSDMAQRVVTMQNTTVREVMVPLPHVVSVPIDCTRAQFVETLTGHNYSRLAVWRDRRDNIIGVVNIYDVLYDPNPGAIPADHLREPIRIRPATTAAEALIALQRAQRNMGVVANPNGWALGVVTIKDLVEEIVGELQEW